MPFESVIHILPFTYLKNDFFSQLRERDLRGFLKLTIVSISC